jgi:hypothetical protein
METGIGDCKAHAGGDNASRNSKVCPSGGAAVQGTTTGNPIFKVVGDVLHRHNVFSKGFAAWIHLIPSLHRWVRIRQDLHAEVKSGRLPGTVGFHS